MKQSQELLNKLQNEDPLLSSLPVFKKEKTIKTLTKKLEEEQKKIKDNSSSKNFEKNIPVAQELLSRLLKNLEKLSQNHHESSVVAEQLKKENKEMEAEKASLLIDIKMGNAMEDKKTQLIAELEKKEAKLEPDLKESAKELDQKLKYDNQ